MSQEGIDKNYKIPKRKSDEMSADYTNGNTYAAYTNTENPVLANSYYNYYAAGMYGPWQQGMMYPTQYPTSITNPIAVNAGPPVEPITQNIYTALSHIKEKPKNNKRNFFKEVVPDVDDPTLPKELTLMFQPLFCKLCNAQLSSNVMAKLHYKSRNHEKKIKKFLVEYSEKTGEPLHKRAKVTENPVKVEEDKNPAWFHCDVCDLPLTGKMHAESHYMGKNHQKALLGYRPPAGKGYYNKEGKWVRQSAKKGPALPEGEDTFGLDFRKTQTETLKATQPAATVVQTPSSGPKKFYCETCNVTATCQEQIDMHFNGQKHQKKLRQLGLTPINVFSSAPAQKSAGTVESTKSLDSINLSVYRTPSGDFYCPSCNLTLNSEPQFKIHLRSKNHLKKQSK